MTPGARIQAAIEVLEEMQTRHRPAPEALKDWGRAHRFAGSGDRSAIGNLIFDTQRRRNSLAARMGSDDPRSLILAAASDILGGGGEALAEALAGPHAPRPLTEDEHERVTTPLTAAADPWIEGDYPEWLHPSLERIFGDSVAIEGRALAQRAPIDLRVNSLKSTREKLLKALARFGAEPTPMSPLGLRIAPAIGFGRNANVEREPAHERGAFEIQDEGSQIAALLAGAKPGDQVADLCAGAGGKTLALAGVMENKGQIYAFDADASRLRPIFARLARAAARNVQVIGAHESDRVDALKDKLDCVFVDAPCTGTGAWRRHPDAKWRLKPAGLEARQKEQRALLDRGAELLRPGGRLIYVTCSVLPEENEDQINGFLSRNPSFMATDWREVWKTALSADPVETVSPGIGLLLTPARHQTDGFYVAIVKRSDS
ncbi:16S rRNA (cytosine967-C5)-methyltransferase [Rhodoligotrophos appendicifer]|uniref:RsmB/NOP family class I SAM-dependent RNA methyltransferase n=1 Tax=Rhodoligotrophos appendicifer TaxID=987056 RepID=UPI00118527BB|nr:RsmB/NOP family class I SAM-dependent RNA methyltransferase [Rhodoligotrophos appendicifer]